MSKSTVFEKFVKGTPFAFRKISDFSKRDPLYGNPIQKVAIALSKFHVFSSPKIRIFSTKCTVKLDSRFRSIENLDRARFSNLEISDLSESRISQNFETSRSSRNQDRSEFAILQPCHRFQCICMRIESQDLISENQIRVSISRDSKLDFVFEINAILVQSHTILCLKPHFKAFVRGYRKVRPKRNPNKG